ncbi:hypothetical protein [Nocardia vaccinii]|uniref:hypothetical protein n=1 Tax=Nocardia vaccinii TaxID=1822 RepID=UPI00082E5667|nr:hypothetical protein [Nocardia vaccinii]
MNHYAEIQALVLRALDDGLEPAVAYPIDLHWVCYCCETAWINSGGGNPPALAMISSSEGEPAKPEVDFLCRGCLGTHLAYVAGIPV